MLILGINALHGDSSAAIVKDGKLVYAIEEERLRRIKHWAGIPIKAVENCLRSINANLEDIDYIVLSKNPFVHLGEKICLAIKTPPLKTLNRLKANLSALSIKDYLKTSSSNKIKAPVSFVEHHRSHITCAYHGSSFKKALILSCDGTGDMRTTMWAVARDEEINIKGDIRFPHSLGFLYTACTQFLGFLNYGDEYKVMGLAPHGRPNYKNEINKIVKIKEDGSFRLDLSYFDVNKESASMTWNNCKPQMGRMYSDKFIRHFGEPRNPGGEIDGRHKDIASSLQFVIEEVILNFIRKLKSKFNQDYLCLTGGVFANSVVCGKLSDLKLFHKIYVPYAPGDAGTVIGALAYFYYKKTGKRIENIYSPFGGPEYTVSEIKIAMESTSLRYEELPEEELLDRVTENIMDKKIVGWFQGRMEFGYRALGNRSILAHPGFEEMKDILNKRIKNREWFRPFAPSVLEEYASEFFHVNNISPYMSFVVKVRKEKIDKIKAVVHVDNTARIQTVSKDDNPLYYRLLKKFYKKTGLPLLLNTSFNENEPIVNSPKEAIDCFLRTKMDALVMGNFIIKKT